MIYEVQITYVTVDDKGNDKNVKNNLVVQNAISFADAEEASYEYGQGLNLNELDVVGVKRSKIKEILNTCQHNDDLIWQAEFMDVFHDDDGNEKEIKYKTILFAQSFDSAKAFISEYMRQGYDNMSLVSLKLTKFKNVL